MEGGAWRPKFVKLSWPGRSFVCVSLWGPLVRGDVARPYLMYAPVPARETGPFTV